MWDFIAEYYSILAPLVTMAVIVFGLGMMTGEGGGSAISDFLGFLIRKMPLIIILSIAYYLLFSYFSSPDISKKEALEISQCKLIEENIDNGLFSRNTNKLDCGGVIRNISTSDYNKAIDLNKKKG